MTTGGVQDVVLFAGIQDMIEFRGRRSQLLKEVDLHTTPFLRNQDHSTGPVRPQVGFGLSRLTQYVNDWLPDPDAPAQSRQLGV